MSNAYGSSRPLASTTRQVSRAKQTAGERYAPKAARRGQAGTAKAVEPTRVSPPPDGPIVIGIKVGSPISSELGKYNGEFFGFHAKPDATGNLTEGQLGESYGACDVWAPGDIVAGGSTLAEGTIAWGVYQPDQLISRTRPIVIALDGGGGAETSGQYVGQDRTMGSNNQPTWQRTRLWGGVL